MSKSYNIILHIYIPYSHIYSSILIEIMCVQVPPGLLKPLLQVLSN